MYSDDRQCVVVRISRAIRSARIEVQNARHRRRRGRPYRQLIPDDVTHIACKREVGSIADHGVPIWLPMRRGRRCFLIDRSRLTHCHRRMRRINDNLGHRHIRRIHRQKRGKRISSGQQKNRHIARYMSSPFTFPRMNLYPPFLGPPPSSIVLTRYIVFFLMLS